MSKASFVAFVAGAVIGSVATWYVTKTKYEQIAREEIEEIREFYSEKNPGKEKPEKKTETHPNVEREKPDLMEYAAKLQKEGYTDYSDIKKKESKVVDDKDRPYVISPEEFGEIEGYSQLSLSFYADQILADDNDDIVENVEECVGFDSLSHFGEYEDDSVFVRNDKFKCDYEILLVQEKYSDLLKRKPYKAEL